MVPVYKCRILMWSHKFAMRAIVLTQHLYSENLKLNTTSVVTRFYYGYTAEASDWHNM